MIQLGNKRENTGHQWLCRERWNSSPLEGEVRWGVGSIISNVGFYGENPPSNPPLKGGRVMPLSLERMV
jgi:hypothetical protein